MTPAGRLVVVDLQDVVGDPDPPCAAPRFLRTRFVGSAAPIGARAGSGEQFPWVRQSPGADLYALVGEPGSAPVVGAGATAEVPARS